CSQAWLNFIEDERVSGQVSDAQWRTYVRQALAGEWINLISKKRVHPPRADMIFGLSAKPVRLSGVTLRAFVEIAAIELAGDEHVLPKEHRTLSMAKLYVRDNGGSYEAIRVKMPDAFKDLTLGPHSGHLRCRARIIEN